MPKLISEYKIIQGMADTVEVKLNQLSSEWKLESVNILRDLVSIKIIMVVVLSRGG